MASDDVQTGEDGRAQRRYDWRSMLGSRNKTSTQASARTSTSDLNESRKRPNRWTMGMLNDEETDEVPGSILLMSKVSDHNEPLGIRNAPARTSASSLPSPYPPSYSGSIPLRRPSYNQEKKRTADGKILLVPQPDESLNDPLNWATWRRDCALLCLGFYCMVGGGMTPVLAAGFNEVAATYDVTVPQVALTTGLYMMGLGVGSVIASPTAILFGKRPVYLVASVIFVLTAVWCALSPSYSSLVIARIFMGLAVSPVECLPSATVAEIFFLHERAYRLGIYTLLLLGGKNLVPLVSAAIIQSLGWRWVFWIVAMVVGFGGCLLFIFVPETFWDRTPRPHKHHQRRMRKLPSLSMFGHGSSADAEGGVAAHKGEAEKDTEDTIAHRRPAKRHAHFDEAGETDPDRVEEKDEPVEQEPASNDPVSPMEEQEPERTTESKPNIAAAPNQQQAVSAGQDYFNVRDPASPTAADAATPSILSPMSRIPTDLERQQSPANNYTHYYKAQPPKTFLQQLRPYSGRLTKDNWFRVAFRPFILFAYPAILWSTLVYSLSIGWLIVLSESVSSIYENKASYHFTPLQTGLVYISPFIGGVLGTAVAGKISDIIVRYISRKNGGIYEPEFRLVMGIPITIFTVIGLMGYGWSAAERDNWIVPTVFFGFISFGCSLGSTTAITFAVDSYRQYAGEALVTLNFSKNIFHGLVFSLFFNRWLEAEGSKDVFIAIGGIQLGCLLFTIPMYIYGKRARMWTVRRNLMERF